MMKNNLKQLLLIIAEFYKEPTEELYNYLISNNFKDEWSKLVDNIDKKGTIIFCKPTFATFTKMNEAYHSCFIGPAEPFAPPVESLYKKWSTDPNANTSIANQTGYFYGDAAVHVRHLYEKYKIEIPSFFHNMPDHLCLQLEFLTFLIDHTNENEVTQYVNDHFDWLDDFLTQLKETNNSEFYVCLTEQLIKIITMIRIV